MFESLDILYIVLAFCVLWFTAFVCWLIWQVAMILKNINDTMSVAREKIEKIEEAITAIRHKFETATSSATLLVEGIKKVVEFAIDKKEKRKSSEKTMEE